MNTKKLFATTVYLLFSVTMWAQQVQYRIVSETISDYRLKTKMENNISRLLTAINDAYNKNSNFINYDSIDIHDSTSMYIGKLWNLFHFKTEKTLYPSNNCVKLAESEETIYHQGNIGVEVKPVDGVYYAGESRREMSIYLDGNGKIIDFDYTQGVHDYASLMEKGKELNDLAKREEIVKWCNYLCNAYSNKDIDFIEDVFSENALILVGNESIKKERQGDRIVIKKKYKYKEYSKDKYIEHLKIAFKKNSYVNVKFDDFEIKRHYKNKNFYGVTLKQTWRSTTYGDEGILFLVWDFTNEDSPTIHVRVWQHFNQERFDIGDFDIPNK